MPPQDRLLDRRSFLERMAVLSAGGASLPAITGCGSGRDPGAGVQPAPAVGRVAPADAADLTVAHAAALIRAGDISPLELVDACLGRIDRWDSLYQAFNVVLAEEARAAARAATDRAPRGPLHGIPLAIKDNFYTAGVRTTANSLIFEDFVPSWDATAVERLRAGGAIVMGKTQMGPLATTRATRPDGVVTTVNAWAPHDASVSPGGSSSGSATAVAARLATSSTGTQTGGSITVPSNAQGLTGLKPTIGRVSLRGIIPLTYTRDHPGPLARDAADAAIMLQQMAGEDAGDPRTLGLPPVPDYIGAATTVRRAGRPALRWPTRIGVLPEYADGDNAAAAARLGMLRAFEELGAELVDVRLPDDWQTLTGGAFNNVRLPERSEPFLDYLRQDVRLFGVSLSSWINGVLLDADVYLKGQRAKLLLLRRVLEDLFGSCDVVVQTTHLPFDMIGLPLIAFPIGIDRSGAHALPIGALLGGLPFGEDRLLSVVAAYQEVTDWHLQKPPEPDSVRSEPREEEVRVRSEDIMDLSE